MLAFNIFKLIIEYDFYLYIYMNKDLLKIEQYVMKIEK